MENSFSIYQHLKNETSNLVNLYKTKQANVLNSFVKNIGLLADILMAEPDKAADNFNDFLHSNGYIDELLITEQEDRIENIHEFINQMRIYLKTEDSSLVEFVQNATLMSSQDEIEEDGDYVKLMTVHTAKGLEFDNVFVYGLVESTFPSARTIQESKDGLEEERRLFYVAITRAKKRLFLSTSGGFSYNGPRIPSRFLREIQITAQKQKVFIRNDDNKTIAPSPVGMRAGSVIKHDIFGEGIVLSEHDGMIDVVFKDPKQGRKTLIASHRFVHLVK